MDSITQIALGAAVAHITLPKSLGKHRLWIGALWGTIPDLDVYIAPIFFSENPLAEVRFHRGFSHSIVFFVLLSLVSGAILKHKFFKENIPLTKWILSVFFILLTHSLLDIFTTWGTQLLWPLPNKFDLHSIFVIDPLYTIPLILGLIGYYLYQQNYWIKTGLLLSSFYLVIGLVIQFLIEDMMIKYFKNNNIDVVNIVVKPTAFNSLLWNVIVETPHTYKIGQYALMDSKIEKMSDFPKNKELIKEIPETLQSQFEEITQGQYTIEKKENGYILNDLRFGLLKNTEQEKQFAFSYNIFLENEKWKVIEQKKERKDGKEMLKKIYIRIKGI